MVTIRSLRDSKYFEQTKNWEGHNFEEIFGLYNIESNSFTQLEGLFASTKLSIVQKLLVTIGKVFVAEFMRCVRRADEQPVIAA